MAKQKVRFSRNDKRPAKYKYTLSYETKPVKKGRKILWQVVEKPTGSIISETFFEADADKEVMEENGVSSYPTLKLFKKSGEVVEYEGDRSKHNYI